jgi:hypothetical protein
MTSNRRIDANRRNSRNSCGPRTAAGKASASRNAMRHGLAALTHRQPVPSAEVEEFARALCDGNQDPILLAQAVKVAESKMGLCAVRAQKVAVIERLRDRHAASFANKDPTHKELESRIMEARQAEATIAVRLPELVAKYGDKIEEALGHHIPASATSYVEIMTWFAQHNFPEQDAVWIIFDAMSDEPKPIDNEVLDWAHREIEASRRDEHEALKAAAPDLVRLDRYECRAWSRQKRAIEEFMMIKAKAEAKAKSTQRIPAAEDGAVCEAQVSAG